MTMLTMTKIIVTDLKRSEAFYRAVCGLDQVERLSGEGFEEVIMRSSAAPGGAVLILFADGTSPPPGEAVLVFETPDVDAFAARVIAAGGTVVHAPQTAEAMGLRFAMFKDCEGHMLEALARLQG